MDDHLARLNFLPDLSSRCRGWGGVVADLHWWSGPGEAMSIAPSHDVVAMRVAGSSPLTQRRDGKVDERTVTYGNVTIHPNGLDSHWSWTKPGAIMLMRLLPSLVEEVHRRRSGYRDLPNRFGFQDAAIESYVRLFDIELHTPDDPSKILRWESLSLALAAHLVDRAAGRETDIPPPHGLPTPALRRVVEYISDHWHERHSLQCLADVAGVSRFHFARMFKASTGMTAMGFVERSRLDRARVLLATGKHGLAEIAILTGFADQSHFAKRFRLAFGVTPGAFARNYIDRS